MARPESIDNVSDRFIRFGSMEIGLIVNKPKILKAYTALLEAIQADQGVVDEVYGSTVELRLARNPKQLQDQLRSDQYNWDDLEKAYYRLLAGEEVQKYRYASIREWAKEEGFRDPIPPTPKEEDAEVS